MKRLRAASLAVFAAVLLAISLLGAEATAHEVGLSRGEYTLAGDALTVRIIFARREVIGLVAGLDADHDNALTDAEVNASQGAIEGAIAGRIKVRGDGAACPGKLEKAALTEEDGLAVHARYTCPAPPREITVELTLLEDLAFGHRHVARASNTATTADAILSQRSRSLTITAAAAPPAQAAPSDEGVASLYALGLQRALTSYDALVFMLVLALAGGRARSLALTALAFAAASSITLVLAARGLWAPSPRVVGPALALSVAYAGADNLVTRDAEARWRVAFPFGLVHGLAFAYAFKSAAAPPTPAALALFDLGLVSGQALALALAALVVGYARRRASFRERGVSLLNAAVIIAGLAWFTLRI